MCHFLVHSIMHVLVGLTSKVAARQDDLGKFEVFHDPKDFKYILVQHGRLWNEKTDSQGPKWHSHFDELGFFYQGVLII